MLSNFQAVFFVSTFTKLLSFDMLIDQPAHRWRIHCSHHPEWVLPMANFVLIAEAVQHTGYKHAHIAWLLIETLVKGKKVGGTWTVDLDDLRRYQAEVQKLGTQKHKPKRKT